MIDRIRISRRIFLRLAGWLAFMGLARSTLPVSGLGEDDPGDALLAQKLTGIFREKGSAAIIGREYLRRRSDEASRRVLMELIRPSLRSKCWNACWSETEDLHPFPGDQVRDDFKQNRVAEINGWVLSETEARLCALAALSPDPDQASFPRS